MNFQQQYFQLQERIKSVSIPRWPHEWKPTLKNTLPSDIGVSLQKELDATRQQLTVLGDSVKALGAAAATGDYEKRKLGIFNQLNFFQLLTGLLMPLIGILNAKSFPGWVWLVISLPAVISFVVLCLNAVGKTEAATIFYFMAYPLLTSIVYMSGINVGTELFFILYGILAVFFLQELSHMLFSVSFSMISYFMLSVVWSNHRYQLATENLFLYLFNEVAGIIFIFYGLFLIKKENLAYQSSVLTKNQEIAQNALVLEQQTKELTELNMVKNKLFSVIAHDLKIPMYSLRNLFRTIQQQELPAKQIKAMLPDMVNNLNYTTGLLENLLQWAKSQMQAGGPNIQPLDVTTLIDDTVKLLQLPAAAKQLTVEVDMVAPVKVAGDKDMILLVLRNLLSNAVKFTPDKGTIQIGIEQQNGMVELYVRDTGKGISPEAMEKIMRNDFFSTNGTAHEPGTGLGLMLCREFLVKNNSQLLIKSSPGAGSTFSFSLPLAP
ncbi:MAG TPA: HAMP domain-containing sensor histidine kinase [Chitinophagaceae bacterium]|nr:HAMP domain-containing sensor histidine kinase [Chitinophagaceae bacterium]